MSRHSGLTLSAWLTFGSGAWMAPGCAFYGSEFDPCFEEGTCAAGSGGTQPASGDGDAPNAGGDSAGGTGGQLTGGSGGLPDVGSGGTPDGGTGGVGTGGGTTGGTGGGTTGGTGGGPNGGTGGGGAVSRIHINELLGSGDRFVELFNAGSAPVDLSSLFVGETPNDSRCRLGAGSLAVGGFLEVAQGATCAGQGPCVADCPFEFRGGDTVYLLSDDEGPLRIVSSVQYPAAGGPSLAQSWAARPDGSDNYTTAMPSPGASNQ